MWIIIRYNIICVYLYCISRTASFQGKKKVGLRCGHLRTQPLPPTPARRLPFGRLGWYRGEWELLRRHFPVSLLRSSPASPRLAMAGRGWARRGYALPRQRVRVVRVKVGRVGVVRVGWAMEGWVAAVPACLPACRRSGAWRGAARQALQGAYTQ